MNEMKKNPTYESTLKSADTEEFLDLIFYRPIGYRWALLFNKLGVTPNAVTIASIFIGIAAGICFYFEDWRITLAGVLLLIWANSYDSADGQLARMTGQKSDIGRALDGVAGDFWFVSIYVAICFRLFPQWSWWIWVLAAFAGMCHSKQAAMADYYRNIHLFFLKGKAGSELDNSVQQKEIYYSLPWKGNLINKVYHYFYSGYTASQEKTTPKFQRFYATVRQQYGDTVPGWLATEFRNGSKPLMKYTNILSFNTRVIVLFISLFFNLPWIYFIFELTVLNALLVYMVHKHESLSNKFYLLIKHDNSEKQIP